jgi:hypothetical protein
MGVQRLYRKGCTLTNRRRRIFGSGRRESINVSTAPLPDRLYTKEKADEDPDLLEEIQSAMHAAKKGSCS